MAGGFESFGLEPELLKAVDDLGYLRPTDVQDETIPLILGGGDVCVAAETGSGKTAAFALPVLQMVRETLRHDYVPSKEMEMDNEPNICLNAADKDALLMLGDNGSRCESRSDNKWSGVRATHGVFAGRYYFEVVVGDGLCRIGWSTVAAKLELGTDDKSYGFGGTGKKSHANTFENYGGEYKGGDVIGCYLDMVEGKIGFSKNGSYLGDAFLLNITRSTTKSTYYPAVTIKRGSCRVEFSSFAFPPAESSGFKSLHESVLGVDACSSLINSTTSQPAPTTTNNTSTPLCIILEPTKDLCEQVGQCLSKYSKYIVSPSVRHCVLFGGSNCSRSDLANSSIIVGTPSKMCEMIRNNSISLEKVRFYILDEADEFVDDENLAWVMTIYDGLPKSDVGSTRLQVCFFSATLHSQEIINLSNRICQNPTWVDLKGVDFVPSNIHQVAMIIDPKEDAYLLEQSSVEAVTDGVHIGGLDHQKKDRYSQIIKQLKLICLLKLIDAFHMSQCLIFCRTNVDCNNLEQFLTNAGGGTRFRHGMEKGLENRYSCVVVAGMRSVQDRSANMQAFKEGSVRFMICTDVAARGIDIQNLPFVINMTLPDEPQQYIHRIGRVGRADALGLAISIVACDGCEERVWYHKCNDRGKNCSRRELLENNGCTMYYNESSYKKAIEKHIGFELLEIGKDCVLPEAYRAASGGLGNYGSIVDAAPDEVLCAEVKQHQDLLMPAIDRLKQLEKVTQMSFINRNRLFGRAKLLAPSAMEIDSSLPSIPPSDLLKRKSSNSSNTNSSKISRGPSEGEVKSMDRLNMNESNRQYQKGKATSLVKQAPNDNDDDGLAGDSKIRQRQERFNKKNQNKKKKSDG